MFFRVYDFLLLVLIQAALQVAFVDSKLRPLLPFLPMSPFWTFCSDPSVRKLFSSHFCLCDCLSLSNHHTFLKADSGFPKVSRHFHLHPIITSDQGLIQPLANWWTDSLASEQTHIFLGVHFLFLLSLRAVPVIFHFCLECRNHSSNFCNVEYHS